MTPAAQGRHCAACNKVVVDFTRMTDAEIVAFLGQSAGAGCGRFLSTQLDRPLFVPLPDSGASWRKRLLAMAALLGLGASTPPMVRAQQTTPARVQTTITLGMVAQPASSVAPTLLPPLVARGVVLDSATHEPLPGVTVLIAGTTTGVSSNKDGEFELTLPEASRKQAQIQVSAVGYTTQHLPISAFANEFITIKLAPSMMGEVVIVGGYCAAPWYTPRGLWQRLKRPFQRW